MRGLTYLGMLLMSLLGRGALVAQGPPASHAPTAQQPQKPSFWRRLLRVSGIAANPGTLKAPQEVKTGQIWLAELGHQPPRRLTAAGMYRSPVFVPGSDDILALEGTDVVRLPAAGGVPHRLYTIPGVSKLVGFSQDDPDQVLMLTEGEPGRPRVGLLSLKTGKIIPTPYNPASSEDRRMLEHLRGWDRVYGDTTVYVKRLVKQSMAGPVEWTDVLLKPSTDEPINVSRCEEVDCGQPSLSADGRLLVFIRAEQR